MLPVPPEPLEAAVDPSSGSAKRRRRNELPQLFLALVQLSTGFVIRGMFLVTACTGFYQHADTMDQFHDLLARGNLPSFAHYVVWSITDRYVLEHGDVILEDGDLNYRGGLVCEGLSFSGLQKVLAATVRLGGESVSIQHLFGQLRIRTWRMCEAAAARVFQYRAALLVTVVAFASQAGVLIAAPDRADEQAAHPAEPPQQDAEASDEEDVTPHGFDFDIMTSAMRLAHLLRNRDHLDDAIKLALRISLPSAEADQRCKDIDDGLIPVPGPKAVAHAWHKLDCCEVIWQRICDSSYGGTCLRYLSADSSQKKYNYFCCRETMFRIPGSKEVVAWSIYDLQLLRVCFAWQCTVLGYGAGNLAYKFRNLAHSILLKCSTQSALHAWRCSVVGWTSDQGTERKLADCAFALEPNYENLTKVCSAVDDKSLPLADDKSAQCFFFPYALIMFGHLHMLFNGLETAVTQSKMWGTKFTEGLQALLTLLNSVGLRSRLTHTCMQDAPQHERSMFDHFAKHHLDWRWESLGVMLNALVPLIPVLIKYWNFELLKGTESESLGTIDGSVIALVDMFLKRQWIECTLEMLRLVAESVNRWSSWLEGCHCHDHIWTSKGSHASHMQRLFEECGLRACMFKGCRGPEMAAFAVTMWLDRICAASSGLLTRLLYQLPQSERSTILAVQHELHETLREVYSSKLAMWSHLPYKLLGMFCHTLHLAKACARCCIDEWQSCTDRPKVHRVAWLFCGRPIIFAQMVAFADGDSGVQLSDFPELFNLVLRYALVSLCERSIEGEHAKIEQATKLGPATPATVCSRIRAPYLISLLDDRTFYSWCKGAWTRHIFRELLEVRYTVGDLKGLGRVDLLKKIYLFGVREQFEDVSQTAACIRAWAETVHNAIKPVAIPRSSSASVALDWMRTHMTIGRIFAAPHECLRFVQYTGYEAHGMDPCSIGDVVSIFASEEVFRFDGSLGNLVFFRIVNPYPNRRVLEHPWHLGGRPLVIAVSKFHVSRGDDRVVLLSPDPVTAHLDLCFMCSQPFVDLVQSLLSFGVIKYGHKLTIQPEMVAKLNDSPLPALTLDDTSTALVTHVPTMIGRIHESPAFMLFLDLLRRHCFAEVDEFANVEV
jgi:hypothetical protein